MAGDSGSAPVVVDLCSGSGAIALSLADEVPGAVVHAVEVDPGALRWAERNLAGSGVLLHAGDLDDALPELDGEVDVVVCNPPYIPLEAWESVAPEVRDHDPATALWSGAGRARRDASAGAYGGPVAARRRRARCRARRRPGGECPGSLPGQRQMG